MKNETPYFLTRHFFKSEMPDWHNEYLEGRSLRITHLLRQDLGNSFWKNYGTVLTQFVESGKLLLRAKVVTDQSVLFAQVWRTEADAQAFAQLANREHSPLKLITKYGFQVRELNKAVTAKEFSELIRHYMGLPHILQYVHPSWRTPGMKLGDPIKKNGGDLPFPEEK